MFEKHPGVLDLQFGDSSYRQNQCRALSMVQPTEIEQVQQLYRVSYKHLSTTAPSTLNTASVVL
jgi:hypothetical protein